MMISGAEIETNIAKGSAMEELVPSVDFMIDRRHGSFLKVKPKPIDLPPGGGLQFRS